MTQSRLKNASLIAPLHLLGGLHSPPPPSRTEQVLCGLKFKVNETYILGNQARNHHKRCFGLGEDGRGAQDIAVREAHREAKVFGTAVIERRHDPLGNFAIAVVEEGLAAIQHLRGGRLVDILAPVGRRVAVGLICQVDWNSLLEPLEGVDGLCARHRSGQRRLRRD